MSKGQIDYMKCWRCGHAFEPANWCPFCGVHDPTNKPDFRVGDEIYASLLQPGMFFRKARGAMVYMCFTHYTRNHWLEIRNNAKPKKFTKISDPKRMHIWGVSSVGNLTGLCHDRKVVLCDEVDFVRGIGQGRKCYEASITYPEDWGPGSEREHPMVGCDGYDEGPLERLIDIAKVLKSDGRNPEYDRALVEIVCGFAGEGGHGDWFKKLGIKPVELFAPPKVLEELLKIGGPGIAENPKPKVHHGLPKYEKVLVVKDIVDPTGPTIFPKGCILECQKEQVDRIKYAGGTNNVSHTMVRVRGWSYWHRKEVSYLVNSADLERFEPNNLVHGQHVEKGELLEVLQDIEGYTNASPAFKGGDLVRAAKDRKDKAFFITIKRRGGGVQRSVQDHLLRKVSSDEDEPGERTFINGEILQFVGRYDRLTLKEGEFVAVVGSQKVRCDDRPDKEILTYWRNDFGEPVSSRIPANHLERTKFKSLEEARTYTKLTEVLSLANQAARQVEEIEDGDKFVLGLLQDGDKFTLNREYKVGVNTFKKGTKVKIKGYQTITSDEQLVKVTLKANPSYSKFLEESGFNGMLTFSIPYNILQRQAPKHNRWPIL